MSDEGTAPRVAQTGLSPGLSREGLQRAARVYLPFLLIVAGHLAITGQLSLPVQVPRSVMDWLQQTVHADVADFRRKLSGLLLLLVGGFLFAVSQTRGRAPARIDVPAFAPRGRASILALIAAGAGMSLFAIVEIAGPRYSTALVLIWLGGLVIIGAALLQRDLLAGVSLRPRLDRLDVLCLLALTAGAAAVLFYRIGSVPNSLWPDEGSFWVNSRELALGRWAPRIFDPGTYTFPAPSNYFQALFIKIGGQNLESWRASAVVASLLAVPPTYLLGRHLLGRPLAIAAVVLLVSSPYFIAFARLGYNNSQAVAPVVTSLYLFSAALNRRSAFLLFLAGATAGLGFYTYQAARTGIVIIVALIGLGVVTRWLSFKTAVVIGSVVLATVVLIAAPLSLYLRTTNRDALVDKLAEGLYFEVFYGKSQFPAEKLEDGPIGIKTLGTHGNAQLFFNPEIHARLIGRGAVRTALVFDDASLVRKHFIPGSLGGPLGSVLLVTGAASALAAWWSRRSQLLLLWTGLIIVGLSVLSSFPPQWTRMLPALPALAMISALGISSVVEGARGVLPSRVQPSAIIFAVVGIIALLGVRSYFHDTPEVFRPPMNDVMSFLGKDYHGRALFVGLFEGQVDTPFLLKEFPGQVKYVASPPGTAETALANFVGEPDVWLFYDTPAAATVLNAAERVLGPGEVQVYRDARGTIIGGSYHRRAVP